MTGWISVDAQTPVYEVGNLFVFAKREDGKSVSFVTPASFAGVIGYSVEGNDEEGEGDGRHVERIACSRWKKQPQFPVILEYRHGRTAFVCRAKTGEIVVSCGGSAIEALGVHHDVTDSMPEFLRRDFCMQTQRFRKRLVESFASEDNLAESRTPSAMAALEKLEDSGNRIVFSQGELGEYSIWGFAEGDDDFCIVGIAEKTLTLTLLFPYLKHSCDYSAEWLDDGLDYYVKGELSVRPHEITDKTKAVVKTSERGGFVLRLCLKQ